MKRVLFIGVCLLLVPLPVRGQSTDQKKATVAFLQNLQTRDGGFRLAPGQGASGVRATSSALRALKYFGGGPRDLASCQDFVKRCFDKESGAFADRPGGKPDVASCAIGIMAVVELKMPTEPYADSVVRYLGESAQDFEQIRIAAAGLEAINKRPPQATAWLEQLARMRNPDGTYGKGDGRARASGGAVAAVLRLGGKVDHPDNVLKALKEGQRQDGGFGKEGTDKSDLETSYRVMRTFHMLRATPDGERVRKVIASCRNDDGGYGVTPGQPSTASGTYYAAIILHWLDEK
jgi:prenyltransferase beta subunit